MSSSSIPRPVLFGVLGLVVIAAAFFFLTKSKSDDSGSTTTTSVPATAAPKTDTKSDSKSNTKPKTGTTAPGGTTQPKVKVDVTTLPKNVQSALDKKKVVAILFWRPQGVEDRAMEKVMASFRKTIYGGHKQGKHIAIFDPGVNALTRWVKITGIDGISQTPSYIVIDPKGNADFQTGFIDGATMANAIVNDYRTTKLGKKEFAKIPTS